MLETEHPGLSELPFADHVRNMKPLISCLCGMERAKILDRIVILLAPVVLEPQLNDFDKLSIAGEFLDDVDDVDPSLI